MSRILQDAQEFKYAFIRRTAEARKSAGYTQIEMAAILGLDQGTYKQYETRSVLPHAYVIKFCTACRVEVDWLFGYGVRQTPFVERPRKRA